MSTSENRYRKGIDSLIGAFKLKGILDENYNYIENRLEILGSWTPFCDDFEAKLDSIDKLIKNENVDFEGVATIVEELTGKAARMGASLVLKAGLQLQEFTVGRNLVGCNEAFSELSSQYISFRDCFYILLVREIETAPLSENLNRFSIGRLGILPKKVPGSGMPTLINSFIKEGALDEHFVYSDSNYMAWLSFFEYIRPKLKKVEKSLIKQNVNFQYIANTIQETKQYSARVGGKRLVEACVHLQKFIKAKDIYGCKEAYEHFSHQFTLFESIVNLISYLGPRCV